MAEHFLKSLDPELNVSSAGTEPGKAVSTRTIKVMAEAGFDLSHSKPKHIDQFVTSPFDYVITVCDLARKNCPVFFGLVKNRIHIGFEDPAHATGTETEVMQQYRKIRDQIRNSFIEFYERIKKSNHD